MKFIRNNQFNRSLQFSKPEIDFLNNFSSLQEFVEFSSVFRNLYNKVVNFSKEQNNEVEKTENKKADNSESTIDGNIADPKYWSEYAKMRKDSELGKKTGADLISKDVDEYGPEVALLIKESDPKNERRNVEDILDFTNDAMKDHTKKVANTLLESIPIDSRHSNVTSDEVYDQIHKTRKHLILNKKLPTPENVLETIKSGIDVDWKDPKSVDRNRRLLDLYEYIYKSNPEYLRTLSYNKAPQQGGSGFMTA